MPRTTRKQKVEAYDALRTNFNRKIVDINGRLARREITVSDWQAQHRDAIKNLHVQTYGAARSGNWKDITFSEWGGVGARLRKQYQYLRGYAATVQQMDPDNISEKYLNNRSKYYGTAARQQLESGIAAEKGLDPTVLPAYPGDGTTKCRTNCKCRWTIRRRGDVFTASWKLGIAEHCSTCLERNRKWKNLKFKNGSPMQEIEPIYA